MINYDTALKLKEAGFQQLFIPNRDVYFRGVLTPFAVIKESTYDNGLYINHYAECVSIPTLRELIDACGDKFFSLHKNERGNWECQPNYELALTLPPVGDTPEEAVASLYLFLNKKKIDEV